MRNGYIYATLGIFPSHDPFEGTPSRAMSLNGYAWVEGNSPNWVDPSGEQCFDATGSITERCPGGGGGGLGNISIRPVTPRPLNFQYVRPPTTGFNGGTSGPQTVVPSQPATRLGGTPSNTPFVSPRMPSFNPTMSRAYIGPVPSYLTNLPREIAEICNAGLCNPNALLDAAGVQGQTRSREQTQDSSQKICDPVKVQQWLQTNPGIPETRTGLEYDYQRHYCGLKYRVSGNGEQVEADGIDIATCRLLDAKYVGDPAVSVYVLGSTARQRGESFGMTANVDQQENDLFRRYAAVLRAPESVNPFIGLDVITNNLASGSYWQLWIDTHGVPNPRIREEPWP